MGDKPWLWDRTCDDQPVMVGFWPAYGYDTRALADIFEQIAEIQRPKTVRAAFKSPPGGAQHRIPLGAPLAPRGGFKPKEKDDG